MVRALRVLSDPGISVLLAPFGTSLCHSLSVLELESWQSSSLKFPLEFWPFLSSPSLFLISSVSALASPGSLLKCKRSTFLFLKTSAIPSSKCIITSCSHVNLEAEHRAVTDYHRNPFTPSTLISFSWSWLKLCGSQREVRSGSTWDSSPKGPPDTQQHWDQSSFSPRLFPMGLWTPLVLPPWLSLPAPYSLFCRALEPWSHLEPVFTELIPAGLCFPRSFSNKGLSGDGNPPWKTVYPLSLVAWRCPVEPHLLSWLILSISSKYHALLKRKSTSSWGNKVPLSASPMYISMEPLTSSRVYPHLPIYFIVC